MDDGCLVRLHDSRGYPGCGLVTQDEWLRRYTQTVDMRRPGIKPVVALSGASSAVGAGERVGKACELPALSFPVVSGRSTPVDPPLLATTMPDWGVPPGSSIPIPWAKCRGRHGEVLDTDVPDDCTSDGGLTETESCA